MYSIVMLAAMTSAPESPDFFCKKGGQPAPVYGCVGYAPMVVYPPPVYGYGYGAPSGGGCCLSRLFCCNRGGITVAGMPTDRFTVAGMAKAAGAA
jgi:hypothetical protein